MENFPVAASSICNTHDSVSIPSGPVYARVYVVMRVYVVSYPAIGTYAKFAPKQKATMLAIMYYSGQLALSLIAICMGRGVLIAASNDAIMSLHKTYYVSI